MKIYLKKQINKTVKTKKNRIILILKLNKILISINLQILFIIKRKNKANNFSNKLKGYIVLNPLKKNKI